MNLIPLKEISIPTFNEAESIIHQASQFLAMVGKNYVKQVNDDSNANLGWNEDTQCLKSRTISSANAFLQFHLPTFSFQWVQEGSVKGFKPIDSIGKTELFGWLQNEIERTGLDGAKLKYIDHYELAEHEIDRDSKFKKPPGELIDFWITIRTNANRILEELNQLVELESEIRIWPHHFDTGTYYPFENDKAIGAGWAIADELSPFPYLYIYPWDKNQEIDLSSAPRTEVGTWRNENWKGAVLLLNDMQEMEDLDTSTSNFLKGVISYLKLILKI